ETGSLKAALLVPSEAVAATAGGPRVFRKGALGPEPVAVELGGWGEGQVEVKSGLAEGDRILARAPEQAG
nr:efflux transporter periplasmic adaptor subunit [Thermoanaerobaculia bacterium]